MKKRLIILTLSLITILVIFSMAVLNKDLSQQENDVNSNLASLESSRAKQEKLSIAACPTCFEAAQKLNPEKYQVIPTASTAESLTLLVKGSVNMILAGRTLKPNEPVLNSFILTDGYSFLSNRPLTVSVNEIKENIVYTDIDINELKQKLPDFSFQQVEDVYDYLEKGIVLTSWENTDYFRAQIVHIIEKDGRRLVMSRRSTLYCPDDCDQEIATDIKSVFN